MQKEKLNEYPQPALLAGAERILAVNDKAAQLFRDLVPGAELPEALRIPEDDSQWEGSVTLEGRMYRVAAAREGEDTRYLLQPQEQRALGEAQLDSSLYQLRTLMGDFRRDLAPYVAGERERFEDGDMAGFSKSYYRMLRLMDHLDLLRDAAAGQLRLNRERMEMGRFCQEIVQESGALLEELGIELRYAAPAEPIFVTADGDLLRTAALELISNCAGRRRGGGVIHVRLIKRGGWVRLCVTDDGAQATGRERLAMTSRGTMPLIPIGGTGAGLGLSVAEEILRLHGGALVTVLNTGAPRVYLAIPAGQPDGKISLHTPVMERNAGMNPYLIALSDVLSGETIREDWKE